jgi:transposase
VQAAARAIPHGDLQSICAPNAGLAFQPRTLLAVLSYCYAHEIYTSSDIENLMHRDAHFRDLCGNEIPDAGTLRHFRRHNHEAIEQCVAAALRNYSEKSGGHPADTEVFVEARQRLSTAILMDMNEN